MGGPKEKTATSPSRHPLSYALMPRMPPPLFVCKILAIITVFVWVLPPQASARYHPLIWLRGPPVGGP